MSAHSFAPAVLTVDAVLFDNDGTLIDSVGSLRRSWARWAEETGLDQDQLEKVGYLGRRVHEVVGELLPEAEVAGAAARLQQLELADAVNSRMLPGAEELLSALPRDRWAVVTATTRALALRRFSTLGLTVPMLVGAEDVHRGHPDPEAFLTAAERLGVSPSRTLVVEDTPAGLAAARAAGMHTLALTTSHTPAELHADVTVGDLSHVRPVIERDGSLALLIG